MSQRCATVSPGGTDGVAPSSLAKETKRGAAVSLRTKTNRPHGFFALRIRQGSWPTALFESRIATDEAPTGLCSETPAATASPSPAASAALETGKRPIKMTSANLCIVMGSLSCIDWPRRDRAPAGGKEQSSLDAHERASQVREGGRQSGVCSPSADGVKLVVRFVFRGGGGGGGEGRGNLSHGRHAQGALHRVEVLLNSFDHRSSQGRRQPYPSRPSA